MTDKEIKDYCKNCDVEPPAMKFKCPECEHNPNNENNFAKDINAPHKEQIIINGVNVSVCEFLTKTGHCKAQMSIMGTDTNKCKCFPNCYFKQLQRKTAECEKYEQAFDNIAKHFEYRCKHCREEHEFYASCDVCWKKNKSSTSSVK